MDQKSMLWASNTADIVIGLQPVLLEVTFLLQQQIHKGVPVWPSALRKY